MPHTESELIELSNFVVEYSRAKLHSMHLDDSLSMRSLILYGGAARFQFGISQQFKDYDLNVFFRRGPNYHTGDARRFNHHGAPWNAGLFLQKKVEVFFNVLDAEQTWIESALTRVGNRWNCLRNAPILLLYPERHDYRRL